jgi:hypothetical protein
MCALPNLIHPIRITTVPEAEGSRVASTSTVYPPEKLPTADPGHSTVLRRSGAACRFHSTRQIKLRLVLHDNEANTSGTITQNTLSHQISFHIQFTVAYTSGHSSPSSTTSIPIVILPQVAPAHEGDFSQEVDSAYRKKHDPPPARTYRMEDTQGSRIGRAHRLLTIHFPVAPVHQQCLRHNLETCHSLHHPFRRPVHLRRT